MSEPTLDEIRKAGALSFRSGKAATECPFAFINTAYWATKDYDGFNYKCRANMDAWMRGWIDEKARSQAGSDG